MEKNGVKCGMSEWVATMVYLKPRSLNVSLVMLLIQIQSGEFGHKIMKVGTVASEREGSKSLGSEY